MKIILPAMILYFILGCLSWAADVNGWLPKNPPLFWVLGASSVLLPVGLALILALTSSE
jgi:hypothetical protein